MGEIRKMMIDGKSYVLLSEEDYEDLVDRLQAETILARVKAGEETWPASLVRELMETNSRIRTFRRYRGKTMQQVATAAGISQPHLSDIENGKKTGSVDVLKRIATALDVDLDDLVV